MNKLFDLDNPFMKALSTAADLILLNVLTVVMCLPIITAGGAITAMNSIVIRMVRNEESYIIKPFFRAFAANFKTGAVLSVILVIAAGFLYVDYLAALVYIPAMRAGIIAIGVILLAIAFYVFALNARYENKLKNTLKNASALAVGYFPRTLLMVLFTAALWVGCIHFYRFGVPILVLFGLSLPCYVNCLLMNPVFKSLDDRNEIQRKDDVDEK